MYPQTDMEMGERTTNWQLLLEFGAYWEVNGAGLWKRDRTMMLWTIIFMLRGRRFEDLIKFVISFRKFRMRAFLLFLCSLFVYHLNALEDTTSKAGLLLAPAEGFGRGFFVLRSKKKLIMLFWPIFLLLFLVSSRNLVISL